MPARYGGGSASTYTSKRAVATKARQASARKNIRKAKKQAVTAKQAYDLALKAAVDVKESKSFHVASDGYYALSTQTNNPSASVAVASMATANNYDGATVRTYGGANMYPLDMAQPFSTAAAAENQGYIPEGKQLKPNFASVGMVLQRHVALIDTRAGSAMPAFDPDIYKACPVRVRIVRVVPKLAKGVAAVFDPDTDLFLNQFQNEQGIASPDWTTVDAEKSPVNTRKYQKLTDKYFTLMAPLVANRSTSAINSSNASFNYNPITCNSPSSSASCTLYPQLTDKKDGVLTYDVPGQANSSSGGRNEFIFIHAWFQNTQGLLNPLFAPAPVVTVMKRVQSTFKDI